jgi:hypothetical protein
MRWESLTLAKIPHLYLLYIARYVQYVLTKKGYMDQVCLTLTGLVGSRYKQVDIHTYSTYINFLLGLMELHKYSMCTIL